MSWFWLRYDSAVWVVVKLWSSFQDSISSATWLAYRLTWAANQASRGFNYLENSRDFGTEIREFECRNFGSVLATSCIDICVMDLWDALWGFLWDSPIEQSATCVFTKRTNKQTNTRANEIKLESLREKIEEEIKSRKYSLLFVCLLFTLSLGAILTKLNWLSLSNSWQQTSQWAHYKWHSESEVSRAKASCQKGLDEGLDFFRFFALPNAMQIQVELEH